MVKPPPERKPDLVPAPVISATGCEPTAKWKEDKKEELKQLSSVAARKGIASWSEDAEAALVTRINAASSKNECAIANAEYERLWTSVFKP